MLVDSGSGTMRLGHDLAVGRKERWCWQLMCMAFIVTVLDFLLLRSGDVEMNPGPTILTQNDLQKVYALAHDACIKWQSIGVQLGLKWNSIAIIAKNYPRDVETCFLNLLSFWLDNTEQPTLESLTAVLGRKVVGLPDIAKEVQQGFISRESDDTNTGAIAVDDVQRTKSTIKHLRMEFKQLVTSMKKLLVKKDEEKVLTYQKFREELVYDAPEIFRNQLQAYFEMKKAEIYQSENYNELFIVFNGCWDYLNPYLLEHLVTNYGEDLVSEMNMYSDNLGKFMNETTLTTYWKAQDTRRRKSAVKPSNGLKKVVTQHELSGTSKLQYIEDIRMDCLDRMRSSSRCDLMRLSRFALFIVSFEEKCLLITWFVPPHVAQLLSVIEESGNFKIIHEMEIDSASGGANRDSELDERPTDEPLDTGAMLSKMAIADDVSQYLLPPQSDVDVEKMSLQVDSPVASSMSSPLRPTKIVDQLVIFLPAPKSENPGDFISTSFGRWLVCEPLYRLDEVWLKISEATEAEALTTTGLKSTTGMYNPSSSGPGPMTKGVISVYTTEENVDAAGYEVIRIVQHDIQYKPNSEDGRYRRKGDRRIAKNQLYWNDGAPSDVATKKHSTVWKENIKDKWHKNIATSPTRLSDSGGISGYWFAETKFENLTELWHTMREMVETDTLGPVKMKCPDAGVRGRRERGSATRNGQLLFYTAQANRDDVGYALEKTGLTCSLGYVANRNKHSISSKLDDEHKVPSELGEKHKIPSEHDEHTVASELDDKHKVAPKLAAKHPSIEK